MRRLVTHSTSVFSMSVLCDAFVEVFHKMWYELTGDALSCEMSL